MKVELDIPDAEIQRAIVETMYDMLYEDGHLHQAVKQQVHRIVVREHKEQLDKIVQMTLSALQQEAQEIARR